MTTTKKLDPEEEAVAEATAAGIANDLKRQRDILKDAAERALLADTREARSILSQALGAL